ncbi:putative cupin superfamily protein [Marisediminicola sp. UYEF4]|uniref:cupin domain-containing protein n=1 Tax=Marisediminicola sp. UYEF4 TaxID=1756384 RepID=UPI0033953D1C
MMDHAEALAVELSHEPVPPEQVVSGQPTTGSVVLGSFAGREYGVWEMSPGAMSDVEVDELFVVVAGAGRVEFADGSAAVELAPGSVGRFDAGKRTVWTVSETLRKIYLA